MVIGITGGVGCGKSKVLHLLEEEYGALILEADKIAHRVMEPGEAAYQEIIGCFGTEILENGIIDRKKLGAIVFSDREKLEKLNAMVHPAVKKYIRGRILEEEKENPQRMIVVEAALLFDDHYEEFCDEVWYVYAEEEIRLQRLKDSRGYSEEKTRSIMKNQMSEKEFRKRCDFVLDNSGSFTASREQIKTRLAK